MKNLTTELFDYCDSATEEKALEAVMTYGSNTKAAEALGLNRRTVDRTMNRIVARAEEQGLVLNTDPKILVLDIETAPMLSYLWSLFKPLFGHNMMQRESYILTWAAKWLGESEVMSDALCFDDDYVPGKEDDRRMMQGIWDLLDEADFIVAHNGDKFDIKKMNTRFLINGFHPPSPYKQIDTLKMAKRVFSFDTNRLDFILSLLLGRQKEDSGGFDTWEGCMKGDMEAWETMLKYNKQDVVDLEDIYLQMRAWDKQCPSAATHGGTRNVSVCPTCNSENVSIREGKFHSTGVSKFQLHQCDDCGTWMRERSSVLSKDQRSALLVKVG